MVPRHGFITGGTWCVDDNKLIARWPSEDTATEVLSIDREGGGSACNMAFGLRRLDVQMPLEAIGVIGDDHAGRFLCEQCDALSVDREQIAIIEGGRTFTTDAFCVENSGQRTHFFYAGVATLLNPDHFNFLKTRARILHLGLPGAHHTMDSPWRGDSNGWVTVLKAARASGLETNLETITIAPDRLAALVTPCLPHLDYLVVNDFEIGAICGIETRGVAGTDLVAVRKAMETTMRRGVMRAVVVHFPEGALALSRDGPFFGHGSLAIPAELVKGANGAGDAFAAGFLYGQHEGWGLQDSLALGHCVAATSMRALSTTTSVAPWRECLQLADRWGFRKSPVARVNG